MSKRKSNRSITCEPLEDRRMFVTYQVTGTSGPDAISISIDEANNKIISAVNGVSSSGSDLINNTIQIDGLGGNDIISITETGDNTVNVFAGTGDDTINIGNGANNLDNIDGDVNVDGEGNSDAVILFDQNNTTANNFSIDGTLYNRVGAGLIDTTRVESLTMNAGSHSMAFFVNGAPNSRLVLNGKSGFTNTIVLNGTSSSTAGFVGSGTLQRAGVINFEGFLTDFTNIALVAVQTCGVVDVGTENSDDALTLTSLNSTQLSVTGSSGGVGMSQVNVQGVGLLRVVTSGFDSLSGSTDTITATGGLTGANSLLIQMGGGTNTFTANSGTWPMQFAGAASATDFIVNNATINLSATASVHRVELNNGGTLGVTAVGVIIDVHDLAVVNGTGTLNLTGFSSVNVPVGGSFAIGAGRTFVKDGLGQLNVSATQLHGNPANLENRAGTTVLHTEAGSSSSRRLNVKSVDGTLRLGSNQHINNVTLDGGDVEIIQFGSRILVASSVSMTARGGSLNLNDNDLIVDVASANQFAGIRQLLASGYADGSWNGDGINSVLAQQNPAGNTTLGALTGSEWADLYGSTAFDGQSVDATSMLIKYTYYGDVDFNGSVDVSDYNLIDFGFVNHLSTWSFGDVDNNGTIDAGDYNLIDFTFTTQGAAL